ncbi:MAG: IS66 family transposase [Gammaproteobacteria bacterium]|nr:IS66 family transposase [Gammaproteobacteria bacterium]MBT7914097.1 IS66 family transposase [Candidatus Bathyarchaeota archaeon]
MTLTDYDLRQITAETLQALNHAQVIALSITILADLKESRERLNQNSSNSSRPPSSEVPWGSRQPGSDDVPEIGGVDGSHSTDTELSEPEDKADGTESNELRTDDQNNSFSETSKDEPAPKGRPGKPKGAPGFGRVQKLPVDQVLPFYPNHCAQCKQPFVMGKTLFSAYTGSYVIDIIAPDSGHAGLVLHQTKNLYYEATCDCGHTTRYQPYSSGTDENWNVAVNERHLVGPLLVALICCLSLRMRLSRPRVREFLLDWLHLELSTGVINQCVHEAGRAVEPVEEEIISVVQQSGLLHADETSWKESGQPLWLWVLLCSTATLYITGRRTRRTIQKIIFSGDFKGWLMSDGYHVYRDYDRRLRCLTHLERKGQGLKESLEPHAVIFGATVVQFLKRVTDIVYQARDGADPPQIKVLFLQHMDELEAFWAQCDRYGDSEHKKTRELAREFMYDWDAIWAVLDDPLMPLTNNDAERALRHWVIYRKISYGTRNPQGSRVFCLLSSVIDTCRQRHASPWKFIAEVVKKSRLNQVIPSLPEVPVSA